MSLPVPDITTQYANTKDGKPTKELFNYLKSLSESIGRGTGNPLSPEMFGANDPAADATQPFLDCIAEAKKTGATIMLWGREYLVSQTLDLQDVIIRGNEGAIIKANADNILLVKNGLLANVFVEGADRALWGWYMTNVTDPNTEVANSVRVNHFKEYGYVLDGLQNHTFTGCFGEHNGVGTWVLANGCRNNVFLNSGASGNLVQDPTADDVNIILLIDVNNPHGFGLSSDAGDIAIGGNDRNQFFNGVFERAGTGIRTWNKSTGAYPFDSGQTIFHHCEFDAPTIIDFQAPTGFNGWITFIGGSFQGDGSGDPFTDGVPGDDAGVWFYHPFPTNQVIGGYNAAGTDFGIKCNNNVNKLLNFSLQDYNTPAFSLKSFGPVADPTVTYTAFNRTFHITPAVAGNGGIVLPRDNAEQIGWRNFSCNRLPLIRISFTLDHLAGGNVILVTEGRGGPFYQTLATYTAAGAYEFLQQTDSNSNGVYGWIADVGTTFFEVANISIEYL